MDKKNLILAWVIFVISGIGLILIINYYDSDHYMNYGRNHYNLLRPLIFLVTIIATPISFISGIVFSLKFGIEYDKEQKRIAEEAKEVEKRRLAEIERKKEEERKRIEAEEAWKLRTAEEERRKEEERRRIEAEKRIEAEEDRKKEKSLIQAAEEGGGEEKYNLAKYYLNKKQYDKALNFYEQAAEEKYIPALRELAFVFREGTYVKKDINTAVYYYEEAAKQNDAKSQYDLLWLYHFGYAELQPDSKKSAYWFSKVTSRKDEYAMLSIARMGFEELINNDDSPALDPKQVFRMFTKILEDYRNPLAMIYIGEMYCLGLGTLLNPVKGGNFIEEGMKHNKEILNPIHYFRIAKLFYEGKTTDEGNPQLTKALEFYEKAEFAANEEMILLIKEIKNNARKEELKREIRYTKESIESWRKTQAKSGQDSYDAAIQAWGSNDWRYANEKRYEAEKSWQKYIDEENDKLRKLQNELNELDKPPSLAKNDIFDW